MVERIPDALFALQIKNQVELNRLRIPGHIPSFERSVKEGMNYLGDIYKQYNTPDFETTFRYPKTEEDKHRQEMVENMAKRYDPGMILIRPEMYHHTAAIVDALKSFGFSVGFMGERIVDKNQYAVMYGSVFREDAARPTWPTRTVVYLNSPTTLVVFTDPQHRFKDLGISLADGFVQNYKGKGGVQNPNTIRGGVVFNEAVSLGFNTLKHEVVAQALDPFHTLRHIIERPGKHPHSHLPKEYAALNYNAVSVHAPNSSELARDMSVLNTEDQLADIEESLAHREFRVYSHGIALGVSSYKVESRDEVSTPNIDKFNRLWETKKITTPLVFLIGGYAGTGKSTVAEVLRKKIANLVNTTPTGTLRTILQRQYSEEEVPELYKNTYDLYLLGDYADSIIDAYDTQRYFVGEDIEQSAHFPATEHQHTIFDGNHISPHLTDQIRNIAGIIPVEFYMKVSDSQLHRKMMQGPTHSRSISDKQFETARLLHDYTVRDAEEANRAVFEYYETRKMLEYVDSILAPIVGQFE